MRKTVLSLLVSLLFVSVLSAQQAVVANRGSGTISVIDAKTLKSKTIALPKGTNKPEPMYVVSTRRGVWVGDRANNRVVRFDRRSYKALGSVGVGKGVFHMWANHKQLWVNNDVDKTTSVIDLRSNKVIKVIPVPKDLVAKGYKCHDVFVGFRYGYVSLLGGKDANDWVIQFSTRTFKEVGRAAVGKDPHLWLNAWSNKLYVPCQGANAVYVLRGSNLKQLQVVKVPGAHGVFLPRWTNSLLVTNISGGGKDGLQELSLGWRGARVTDTVDTKYPTPHNVAASTFGRSIFVTHSGPTANKVTVYRRSGWWWWSSLKMTGEVTVGTNPFGLAYVR